MKLIELLQEDDINTIIPDAELRKQYHKEKDLEREPSPRGEGNRLSPLTIPNPDPVFDRAIGPVGALRKDGSKKDPKGSYTTTDHTIAPVGNPAPVVPKDIIPADKTNLKSQ